MGILFEYLTRVAVIQVLTILIIMGLISYIAIILGLYIKIMVYLNGKKKKEAQGGKTKERTKEILT